MANTFAINLEKTAGFPRATLGVLLRDAAKAETEASGTIAEPFEPLRPTAARPFVSRGEGVAAPTTAFSYNYSNQAERFDPLKPEGEESEYPDGYDPGDSQPTGSFTVRVQDATFDDLADADTAEAWTFGWRVADALGVGDDVDAVLRFINHNTKIDRSPLSVNTPGRLTTTYNYIVEQSTDGPATTIELINDVPYYIQYVPEAFASDDWSVAPDDVSADVTITDLPFNGNSPITDIEYRVGAGSWTSSGGITSFTISGLTNGVAVNIALRAKNAIGIGPASTTKSVTPAA
jgi:hypothetical protein